MTIEEEIARILHENFNAARGRNGVSPLKLAQSLSPLLNRVRAEALREAAGDLSASAKGSAALQRAHDIAEGMAPIGTSTPNEAEWYQMGNWARSTLLAFAARIEQNSEGNET